MQVSQYVLVFYLYCHYLSVSGSGQSVWHKEVGKEEDGHLGPCDHHRHRREREEPVQRDRHHTGQQREQVCWEQPYALSPHEERTQRTDYYLTCKWLYTHIIKESHNQHWYAQICQRWLCAIIAQTIQKKWQTMHFFLHPLWRALVIILWKGSTLFKHTFQFITNFLIANQVLYLRKRCPHDRLGISVRCWFIINAGNRCAA